MTHHDSDRQSGRTFNQLKKCVELAVEGKNVVFVVHNRMMLDYAINLVGKHPEIDLANRNGWTFSKTQSTAKLLGGGSIKFVAIPYGPSFLVDEAIRRETVGMPSKPEIFFDHAWSYA